MQERNNIISVGLPLVDQKTKFGNVRSFEKHPGGITPNILSTFVRLQSTRDMNFFSKVGNDENGKLYVQTSPELGQLQVDSTGLTGTCTTIVNKEGRTSSTDTSYNSASEFEVYDSDLKTDGPALMISDLFTLQIAKREKEVRKIFERMRYQGGIFALNLAGIQSLKTSVFEFFNNFDYHPNLIFGNKLEMSYVGENPEIMFPKSDIVITTLGNLGSTIQFGKQRVSVPIFKTGITTVDESGAGDCYMGTMLAVITNFSKDELSMDNLVKAAQIASHASALVITNKSSRLNENQILRVSKLIKENC